MDTPAVLTPAQIAELVEMIAASPLPMELKEAFADVLETSTQEELARLYVVVKDADTSIDEAHRTGLAAAQELATAQARVNRAHREESEKLVAELSPIH